MSQYFSSGFQHGPAHGSQYLQLAIEEIVRVIRNAIELLVAFDLFPKIIDDLFVREPPGTELHNRGSRVALRDLKVIAPLQAKRPRARKIGGEVELQVVKRIEHSFIPHASRCRESLRETSEHFVIRSAGHFELLPRVGPFKISLPPDVAPAVDLHFVAGIGNLTQDLRVASAYRSWKKEGACQIGQASTVANRQGGPGAATSEDSKPQDLEEIGVTPHDTEKRGRNPAFAEESQQRRCSPNKSFVTVDVKSKS